MSGLMATQRKCRAHHCAPQGPDMDIGIVFANLRAGRHNAA